MLPAIDMLGVIKMTKASLNLAKIVSCTSVLKSYDSGPEGLPPSNSDLCALKDIRHVPM